MKNKKPTYITGGILQAIRNDVKEIEHDPNMIMLKDLPTNLDDLVNKIFDIKNIPKNPIVCHVTKDGLVKMTKEDKEIYIKQMEDYGNRQ
jgi:hypothetical protein